MKATIDAENKTLTILDQNFKIEELLKFISDFNLQDYTINNTATPYWTVTTPSIFTGPNIRDLGYDYDKLKEWTTTSTSAPSKQ